MVFAMKTAWVTLRHADSTISRGKDVGPTVQQPDIMAFADVSLAKRLVGGLTGYKITTARQRGTSASSFKEGRR